MTRRLTSYFALFVILLFANCTEPQLPETHHGSYEAMHMIGAQRAYPNHQIPTSGYLQAHAYMQEKMVSSSTLRDEEPWESLGPHNISGRTLTLALNPQNTKTIWAGSASGGLWRSHNRGLGVSWDRIELGHPALSISSIAFAPNDSMTMYIGTGEVYNIIEAGVGAAYRNLRGFYGMGILKSTDGGKSWEKSLDWSYNQERGVWKVAVAPTNPNVVYAATTVGTYKSINAGNTWAKVHDVPMVMDLVVHPEDFEIVFTGCGNFGSGGKGIYRTIDGGQSWTKALPPVPSAFQGKIMLDISTLDPNIVYASIGNGFGSADAYTWLCKTENRGDTWQIVSEEDYSKWQGWFSHDVAIHPDDPNILIPVGITVHKIEPGIDTIRDITEGGVAFGTPGIGVPDGPPNFTHSDHHDVIYDPSDSGIVYVANDGGVYVSFDSGETYQSANGGYQTVQFYNGFSVAHDISDYALGGLQDNSTIIYTGDLAWTRVIGGDGSWTAINPDNHMNHFGSAQFLNVFRTLNGGANYQSVGMPFLEGDRTAFIAPYVISPSNPDIMYAGRAFVYKSNENGNNDWEAQNGEKVLNGDPVFSMEVAPTNENVLYAATAPLFKSPSIFVTQNGGDSFKDITNGLPNRYILDITVDPKSAGTVFITLGGFGTSHVWMSNNFGDSWTDIGGTLPDVPTSAIIVDPMNSNYLYAGNDLGVFFSPDQGVTWEKFNDGFIDAAMVMDLKIHTGDRKLYVATHGSGAFRRDLVDESTVGVIDHTDHKFEFEVFPIPFTHQFQVRLPDTFLHSIQWKLTDQNGKTIKQGQVLPDNKLFAIDKLQHLPGGSYVLTIESEGWGSGAQVLIKQN